MRVDRRGGQQFLVAADGADGAPVQDDDLVGIGHRVQVVRDDDRGAARHQPAQRSEHPLPRRGVQPGGRLVEEQQRRIPDDGPGDREPLALTARQQPAALADPGVVALVEPRDEAVRVGGFGRRAHLRVGGVGLAPPDVLGDGAVEDQGLLQHRADVATEIGERQLAQVDPVERDAAPVGVVAAQEELRERRLPRAARPDDRDLPAGCEAQVDPAQRGLFGAVVGEPDLVEADRPDGPAEHVRLLRLGDRGPLVEHLDDALGARRGGEQRVRQAREALDGPVELAQVRQEGEQPAEGDRALGELVDGHPRDGEHADALDEAAERPEQRLEADREHLRGERRPILLGEPLHFVVGAVVGLHEGDVPEVLLRDRGDRAGTSSPLTRCRLDTTGERAGQQQERGRRDEGSQRQVPVQKEHRTREENDLERVSERQVDAGEHQLLDGRDIAGETGDEVADLAPFEPADR